MNSLVHILSKWGRFRRFPSSPMPTAAFQRSRPEAEGIEAPARSSPLRTLGADHSDSNGLALAFWILQPRLLRLFLFLEGLRQWRKLTSDVFKEQPPLNDSGHLKLIAQAAPTCVTRPSSQTPS